MVAPIIWTFKEKKLINVCNKLNRNEFFHKIRRDSVLFWTSYKALKIVCIFHKYKYRKCKFVLGAHCPREADAFNNMEEEVSWNCLYLRY